jgi:hypothetical protein
VCGSARRPPLAINAATAPATWFPAAANANAYAAAAGGPAPALAAIPTAG